MSLPDPLITVSPARLSGTPVFSGTRVPLQALFDYLEGGEPLDEFLIDSLAVDLRAIAAPQVAESPVPVDPLEFAVL